jgi:Coenzyme PQQ synthesis protein D (PqqD)
VTAGRFRRVDDVFFEVTGDRAVLLDSSGTELITLNPVGTVVGQILDTPRSAAEVAEHLHATFPDVPRGQLLDDAEQFLVELAEAQLVTDDAPR